MDTIRCPRCGCTMTRPTLPDVSGDYVYSCTNRGQYGGGACGHVERRPGPKYPPLIKHRR